MLLSCRTGPLRVERPLRGVYTCIALIIFGGLPVGRKEDATRFVLVSAPVRADLV
jgi:hypothetical protein